MTDDELHTEAEKRIQEIIASGIRADQARAKVHEWMEQQKKEASNG